MALSNRAWAEIFLMATLWGGSFLAFALALRELPVLTVVALRLSLAAIAFWVITLATRKPLPGPRFLLPLVVMGALNNALPFTLIAWAQTSIESGLASILNATTAFFGILLAAAFLRDERLSARKLAGVALGFLGVVVTIGPEALGGFDIRSLAQLAMLGAATSYASAGIWARKTLRGVPPHGATLGMLTAAAAIMVPLALAHDGMPDLDLRPSTWGALAYISLIATAAAYLLYYRVLAMAGSGNLMLVTIMVSPIAILLGALVLGETLSPTAYLGFAVLSCGLMVIDGRVLRKLGL